MALTLEVADWQRLLDAATVGPPLGSSPQDARIKTALLSEIPPPPVHALQLTVVAGGSGVEVTDAPEGKTVDCALCNDKDSSDGKPLMEPKGLHVGDRVKGKPGHEWIDAHVTGDPTWWSKAHGRIKVTVAPTPPPPPPPVEPPVEPPKPGAFKYGSNMKGWSQAQELADAKRVAPKAGESCVRLEHPSAAEVQAWLAQGHDINYLQSGSFGSTGSHFTPAIRALRSVHMDLSIEVDPQRSEAVLGRLGGYLSGGVKQVNRGSFASAAAALMKSMPGVRYFGCINEWGGDWFWGTGALSAANGAAMVELLIATDAAFRAAGVTAKIIGGADGGHAGDGTALRYMLEHAPDLAQKLPNLLLSYHPYIGSNGNPNNPLTHWAYVEDGHKKTGLRVAVDEAGLPTVKGTGDSPLSTEPQQANFHKVMKQKCRESGFVEIYNPFGYRDGSNPPGYGLFHSDDSPKPSVNALATA